MYGTTNYGFHCQGCLGEDKVLEIHGFVDVEWVSDLDHRISTIGYVFNRLGGAITWMRKRHFVMSLSTIKVEYMETTHVSKEEI